MKILIGWPHILICIKRQDANILSIFGSPDETAP